MCERGAFAVKRVVFAWASSPTMPGAALRLHESLGWQPVLWIAPLEQRDCVQALFPDVMYQDLEDAFLGLPLPEFRDNNPAAFDGRTWAAVQKYLARLMNQMNRFGPSDHFLYEEREAFARRLLNQWHTVLLRIRPEVIFFEESPNSPYMYAIQILAELYQIATISFCSTTLPQRSLLREHIEAPVLGLREAYGAMDALTDDSILKQEFPVADPVREAYEHLRGGKQDHWYMERQRVASRHIETRGGYGNFGARCVHAIKKFLQLSRWRFWLARARADAERDRLRAERGGSCDPDSLLAHAAQDAEGVRLKYPGEPLGFVRYSSRDTRAYLRAAYQYKKELHRAYLEQCSVHTLDQTPFVYFPLQYRPERTVNPDGGVFFDQYLALAMINEALPDGWLLYVKEHPTQFSTVSEGERGRTIENYQELLKLHKLRLVSPVLTSSDLLKASCAVFTVTGTVAWEAACRGKPAFYFGYPWYVGCPGTTRARSVSQLKEAFTHLDRQVAQPFEMDRYLRAFSAASFPYVQNNHSFDPPLATDDEQIDALVSALTWWQNQRGFRED
jgi:hypothetical protein